MKIILNKVLHNVLWRKIPLFCRVQSNPAFCTRGHWRRQAQSPVPRGFYIYLSICLLYIYTYLFRCYYFYRLTQLPIAFLFLFFSLSVEASGFWWTSGHFSRFLNEVCCDLCPLPPIKIRRFSLGSPVFIG